MGEMLKS